MRQGIILGWLAILAGVAGPVRGQGIQSTVTEPIAVRGGVLMVPVAAHPPRPGWPSQVSLTLADGRRIPARLILMHGVAPAPARRWTDDPRRLAVRELRRDDDLSDPSIGTPFLLARLPADGAGAITLGRQALRPIWSDRPARLLSDRSEPPDPRAMSVVAAADRPDPDSPFEYWRWVLLAERLNQSAPAPTGASELERLAAAHYADLWRLGLARLSRADAPLARRCLERLTDVCTDGGRDFAAWVADPKEVRALLMELVNYGRSEASLIEHAREWLDRQGDLLMWTSARLGDEVELSIVNRRNQPLVARFRWDGAADDVPIAVELPARTLTRARLDRPPPSAPVGLVIPMTPAEPQPQVLRVEVGRASYEVLFGERFIPVKPPGAFFDPLRPTLALADVQLGGQPPVRLSHATFVHVRQRAGRWEVFLDCRRPEAAAGGEARATRGAAAPSADPLQGLRGSESVTLFFGPPARGGTALSRGERWRLTVREGAGYEVLPRDGAGSLQVHQRSYADRWLCRVELPESWVNRFPDRPTLLGCLRAHGDSPAVETGPDPALPWRLTPAPAALDLSLWDDPLDLERPEAPTSPLEGITTIPPPPGEGG